MNIVTFLKVLHVATAILFVTGLIGRSVTFRRAGASENIQLASSFLHLSDWFERRFVIPHYMGVLVTGLLLAWQAGWPLWSALTSDAPKWPVVSLLLFLSPWLFIPTYLAPHRKRRHDALSVAVSRQTITPELTSALHDRGVLLLRHAEMAMTGIVMLLMVAEPF